MMRHLQLLPFYLILSLVSMSGWTSESADQLERVTQELVMPPFLPEHSQATNEPPKIVQIRMVIEEKAIEIDRDVTVQAMTYNGSVPGPIIVVHENDYVELTLVNPKENVLLHNIDFHAATG